MRMTVLGIQNQDYISKKTGNPVKGVTLHCSYPDQAVDGEAVDGVYISDALPCSALAYSLVPGQVIDLEYNRRGYVADITLVDTTSPANKK